MAESPFGPLGPLDGGHDRTAFDCGAPALNLYLRNYALQNQKRGIVRNYVTTRAGDKGIVAYYSPFNYPQVYVFDFGRSGYPHVARGACSAAGGGPTWTSG